MDSNPKLEELLRHTRWVEELAQRLVRDPAAAQDLAQSAFVIALGSHARPRSNLRGWLGAVVRNLARESHRRERQRLAVERAGAREESLPSADELLARAEAERQLVEIVMQLEEPHRTTLLLRYFEGLAPQEIARREGVELSVITHRVTRAHARLREKLRERAGGPGWLAALVPILRTPAPSGALPVWSLAMATALKIAVPVLVLAGVALFFLHGKSAESSAAVAPAQAPAEQPAKVAANAPPLERAPVAAEPSAVKETTPAAAAPAALVGRIHGRVYRPDGQLTNGRKVRLVDMAPANGKGQGELWAECNAQGAFDRADLEPGVWSISTWPDEAELKGIGIPFEGTLQGMSYLVERTRELAAGADVDLELGAPPKNPIHVRGHVLQDGAPHKPMAVQWLPAGEGIYDLKKNARVAPEGEYETTLETPGTYYVTVILEDSRPEWTVVVPQVAELTQDLVVEPFALEGRVVKSGDRPVAKATVELSVAGGRRAPGLLPSMGFIATADSDGRFRFAGLPDAIYMVHAYGGELGAAASRAARPAPAGEKRELVLSLEPGIRVPVRVLDPAGREKFASVFVFDASGEPLDPASGQLLGKEKPKTLIPLAPGRYSVVAAAGALWSAPQALEIVAGAEPALLELHLEPAALVEVDASACPGALIEAVDEAGRRFGSLIDRARFNRAVERSWHSDHPLLRLPPGNYVVSAIGREGVLARVSAGLAAGANRPIRLAP